MYRGFESLSFQKLKLYLRMMNFKMKKSPWKSFSSSTRIYLNIIICTGIQVLMYFLLANDVALIQTNLPSFLLGNYLLSLLIFPCLFLFSMVVFSYFSRSSTNYGILGSWAVTILYCFITLAFLIACFHFASGIVSALSFYPALDHKIFENYPTVVSATFYIETQLDPLLQETSFAESHTLQEGTDYRKLSIHPSKFFQNFLSEFLVDSFSQYVITTHMKSTVVELMFNQR